MTDEFAEPPAKAEVPPEVQGLTPAPAEPPPRPAPQRSSVSLSDIQRGLPYSDDAEKGVLSCFLQNPVDLLADAQENLAPDAFYHPVNRQLYEELLAFMNRTDRKPLDLVTLSQHLIDKGLMDKIGGPSFIAELLSFVPTAAHYPYYKGILRDKWLLRRAITYHTEGIQMCYEHQENLDGLLDRLESGALAIRPTEAKAMSDDFQEGLHATVDAVQLQMSRGGELAGLSTGLPWLDEMTGGLVEGLYVIAARPSMAKTALALNIFEHIAVNLGEPCGVFSLEMSTDALIRRVLAKQGWIPLSAIRKGQLDKDLQRKFMQAQRLLREKVRARIDDRPGLTLAQVANKARRWKKQYGIKALFLDYLQRMGTNLKGSNTRDAHAENSTGLANLKKELGIPIIVLAQLNRDCETEKRPPRMSDVEGCGRIEQDGDVIALLSRHKKQPAETYNKHIVINIDKNRDGPVGSEVHLFRGPFMRFEPDPIDPEAKPAPKEAEAPPATSAPVQPALI